jgi:putative nucleotidyltransferase with HDIG domain
MTVPIRRSSVASAMMRLSMDDALTGLRLLVAGGDLAAVAPARDRLAALGADVTALVGDADDVARAVAAEPPQAVLAADGLISALHARLDPFGVKAGPPIVPLGSDAAAFLPALVELRRLRMRTAELEAVVADHALARRREAEAAEQDTLQRLLRAAGYRDDNTYEHTQRVAALAARLASGLGLGAREVTLIQGAAPLHDIGKIAIPDSILLKPGRLTEEEFEVVKTHAVLGARVLSGGESELMATAETIARHHHERWDGQGYPDGLAGDRIPIAARLVHLADVLDVLVHERPYRESMTYEAAALEIARGAGSDFDPEIVRVFARIGSD